jgi:leucyl-tRNA synthetase
VDVSRLLFVAWLLLIAAPVSAQTEITDATVDDLLRRVTAWAKHVRDVAPGSRNPAADYAFAERTYQRVLATIGRTFGADHETAFDALMGLAAHYLEQRREAEADPLLTRAMRIAEHAPAASADHRRAAIARVLGQQGLLEEGRGRQGDAEVCYRQALDMVGPFCASCARRTASTRRRRSRSVSPGKRESRTDQRGDATNMWWEARTCA